MNVAVFERRRLQKSEAIAAPGRAPGYGEVESDPV